MSELPDFAVCDGEGFEQEVAEEDGFELRGEPAQEKQTEEGRDVQKDELAGGALKGWEAERDLTGTGHGRFLISS